LFGRLRVSNNFWPSSRQTCDLPPAMADFAKISSLNTKSEDDARVSGWSGSSPASKLNYNSSAMECGAGEVAKVEPAHPVYEFSSEQEKTVLSVVAMMRYAL